MEADPQFASRQVPQINKELRFHWINSAIPHFDRVQRIKTIDDRLIQSKADTQRLDGILLQPRIMDTCARGISGQHPEQKKIQDKDK
jgi:hypothetical protein